MKGTIFLTQPREFTSRYFRYDLTTFSYLVAVSRAIFCSEEAHRPAGHSLTFPSRSRQSHVATSTSPLPATPHPSFPPCGSLRYNVGRPDHPHALHVPNISTSQLTQGPANCSKASAPISQISWAGLGFHPTLLTVTLCTPCVPLVKLVRTNRRRLGFSCVSPPHRYR